MRMKNFAASFAVLFLGLVLTGCAVISTQYPADIACTTRDTNAMLKSGEYRKKVDNFLIIQDASTSMLDKLGNPVSTEPTKLTLSKDLVMCLNDTLPNEFDVNAGMRVFGPTETDDNLIYGMTQYSNQGLKNAILSVTSVGNTPMANALKYGADDLAGINDRIAVILFSDGLNNGVADPVAAAATMKEMYGNNICIYTVLIGNSPEGRATMEQIAAAGECGFATEANNLHARTLSDGSMVGTVDGMADFVTAVFLEKFSAPAPAPIKKMVDPDSDGDGVPDSLDQCPNTPKGIKVDKVGCPIPIPEKVSITLLVEFDFDKSVIKSEYHVDLEKAANFLKAYPKTNAVLEGHTDSIGSDEYNMELSKRRAASVKNYLVEKFGIDAARLSAVGYGESQPVASNKTDAGRQKNRRVEANIETMTTK